MADSVQVFDAGFRVLDSSGNPVSGAKIKFRLAGPGASMNVYSDKDLSSSLGSTVYTRSDGYPVVSSGSSTTTLIYTGTSAYNIEITDADDTPLFPAKDNVRGAIDTSGFLTSASASTLSISVVNVTSDLTVGATHKGKLLNCDPSSGTFTLTLTSAVTLGDGWSCEIKHKGTANHVRITTPQNIEGPWGLKNSFSLEPGESALIRCDGATFKVTGTAPAYMMATLGRILIEDRISADPGSVTARNRYICTASFTAGGVTTAIGDIIEATGQGTFIKYTPSTDCGWIAYVKDEDELYCFENSAWVQLVTLPATQAEQEAATSLLRSITPGRQQYHPSAAKFFATYNAAATVENSYNLTSVTDAGTGSLSPNIGTDFSSATWTAVISGNFGGGAAALFVHYGTRTAGTINIVSNNTGPTFQDITFYSVAGFGDQ